MADILIISTSDNFKENIISLTDEYKLCTDFLPFKGEEETLSYINTNHPSIVILDDNTEGFSVLAKKIKNIDTENTPFIILACDMQNTADENDDFTGFIDAFIHRPVRKNILIPTLSSLLKTKKITDKFKEDNKELNRSLYQLDVLYNTSSKLSGNLDKEKLFEILFETLEKTLSFDTALALIYAQSPEKENKLMVHSLKKPEQKLLDILKEKIVLFSRENNGTEADFSKIEVQEFIKPSYKNETYDIKLLNFDKLTAPIKVKDKTFGTLLIYRNKPFTKEDVVCFQSIAHQIASSLRAIVLYNEIKNANVELKKLERIKSEFVSIVSHELRTPLTPINNSLEIVLHEDLSEPVKNFINMAKRNVSRLSGIIEDLLDLSRIQTGKFECKYKKYNIKSSLDLITKTFEGQAKEKDMLFSTDFEDSLPDIYADCHRIEQILSNLVTNALKFTPKGGSIKISAKKTDIKNVDTSLFISPVRPLNDFEGEYVIITVKDTGVGIKKEDINKIFDKFSQIENSLTRNAGGVGLGLTISKHFVDAHLGAIFVESAEGEGSAFNILIPVYNDTGAFETDLYASEKIHRTTSLITLTFGDEQTMDETVQKLKCENIIKLLKNSKEAFYKKDGGFIYKVFFPDMQNGAFEFMTGQIQNFINSFNATHTSPIGRRCDIVLEKEVIRKQEDDFI